jgi:RNA polymerase sigma factor (sigma-70 family)
MRERRLAGFFERLWTVFVPSGDGTSDRDLLGRFAGGDSAAFNTLVQRHGPMVLGVCRRVLGNSEDAEDAFQATFVILARKARAVRWRESARGWLYEVAYRTSCKARTRLHRRREIERSAAERTTTVETNPEARELVSVLDEELARLPESYRMPLVLCCLQDQTVDEAARQLGCTPAAVKNRLQRGRERLRDRLARRGFALSIALLMATLAQGVVASVPTELGTAVVRTVTTGQATAAVMTLVNQMQTAFLWAKAALIGSGLLALAVVITGTQLIRSHRNQDLSPSPALDSAPLPADSYETPLDGELVQVDRTPVLGVSFTEKQRYGFSILTEKDPHNPNKFKKLTFMEDGSYNNTCVRIDGDEILYGDTPGHWARDTKGRRLKGIMTMTDRQWVSVWEYPRRVRVTQTITIVPNEDTRPAKLNTALIHYRIENNDNVEHQVGLRVLLDTYIGAEDGVPFAIPGQSELVTTKLDLNNSGAIPAFIQALERPNLEDPGTTATMMLKFPPGFRLRKDDPPLDPIVRLVICRFPGDPNVRWDFTADRFWDMDDPARGPKDSCVTLYWPETIMRPHSKRALAFSYGLGRISSDGAVRASKLALTFNPKPTPGSEFTVTAWIKDPRQGQQVTVNLPTGMTLVEPASASQRLPPSRTELAQVSWRVKVSPDARLELCKVTASTNGVDATVEVPVRKRATGIFLSGI